MARGVVIGLVGDFSASVVAHRAIPAALDMAAQALDVAVSYRWIPTDAVASAARVTGFDGLWCVPGSPYRSLEGALLAIRHSRETGIPFLGTCGGFQHAVIEYARNVLGWGDAAHAESEPNAERAVIAPLECGLLADEGTVRLFPGTHVATAYGDSEATEEYLCRFGLNPAFVETLVAGPLRAAAADEFGDVRAVELDGHPFYVATLFQPERAALKGRSPRLVAAFVRACAARGGY